MPRSLLLFLVSVFPLLLQAQLFPQLGAQRAGISALTFLKMDVSPRSAALASANICLTGDGYSTYTNPATVAEVDHFVLAAANTFWVADINFAYLSSSFATQRGHFGISLSGLNSGRMPVRTSFQPEGTGEYFYATYMTAGLTYSQRLTDQFSWGVNAKFVQERLAEFTANTGVVDLGFLYHTDFKDLRFAVMVQSFGPNSSLKGVLERDPNFFPDPIVLEDYPAPTVFKLGIFHGSLAQRSGKPVSDHPAPTQSSQRQCRKHPGGTGIQLPRLIFPARRLQNQCGRPKHAHSRNRSAHAGRTPPPGV
jgi:hypothetical protein